PVAPANAPALPHSRPTQERFFWPSRPYYAATRLMIAMKPVAFVHLAIRSHPSRPKSKSMEAHQRGEQGPQ
ncbi:MAG: hypothetical protein WAV18_08835, partial [Roseiarcus sp.]